VVSLVPNFNRAIAESVVSALPETPFATVLTDFADYPPHFWIERESQYLICGSARAVEQARALGHSEERIFRTSGMILHPRYYEPVTVDRGSERQRLGLDPGRRTALVMFGGQGNRVMLEIAARLDKCGLDLQLILICGRNEKLLGKLRAAGLRVEGDLSRDKLGAKIRRAQVEKCPYMIVIGDKEVAAGTVSARRRDGTQLPPESVEDFARRLLEEARPPF